MSRKGTKKSLEALSKEDQERMELLQKAHEKKGKQLRVDEISGDLKEFDELKAIVGKEFDNPEEKYQLYYKGLRNILMNYLPKGPSFKEARQIIYDEKNVFLNLGKKKSDNNGVRGSDGRMTYQKQMSEMLELVIAWVADSQNPIDLYTRLYDLNEKYNYGHEVYDDTSIKMQRVAQKMSEEKQTTKKSTVKK